MPEFSTWPAPAKLNLFLHITGRRPDGYHTIETCFQLLDWGDEIELAVTEDGAIVRQAGMKGVSPEDDLAVRAARLLQTSAPTRLGAVIRVRKHVSAGAGLGGGSSDAATVLLALNELWSCGLSRMELSRLGARLGADVPAFVHGLSAWAGGRGDQLEPVSLGDRHYVLVFPDVHVSTADLFAAADLKRDCASVDFNGFDPLTGVNVFEPVVRARYPAVDQAMRELQAHGRPRLTGTGSCIFLPVEDKFSAESITHQLECRYNVCCVDGVDRSPVLAKRTGGN